MNKKNLKNLIPRRLRNGVQLGTRKKKKQELKEKGKKTKLRGKEKERNKASSLGLKKLGPRHCPKVWL